MKKGRESRPFLLMRHRRTDGANRADYFGSGEIETLSGRTFLSRSVYT